MTYNPKDREQEKKWEREFREEREKRFRQFIEPWYEADDEEAQQIIMRWASGDENAHWLIHTVLEQKFLRFAVELLDDEAAAIEVFETTFLEFQHTFEEEFKPGGGSQPRNGTTAEEVSEQDRQGLEDRTQGKSRQRRKEVPLYQGKNQSLALFSQLLKWRCLQQLRPKKGPLSHIRIPGKSTWSEILAWLIEEEDETSVQETIAADTLFTETYGGWPGPEEYAGTKETQEELAERLKGFVQDLSPALLETWRIMLQITEDATSEMTKRELFRRTRETLNIEPSTLSDRVHQTKLVWRKWFNNPPPNKKGPKKKR